METVDPRLELIDARLVVGGSLAGSRRLAASLLADYGPALALPFAPRGAWRVALTTAYPDIPLFESLESLDAWARRVPHPTHPRAEFVRGRSRRDRAVRDALRYGLYYQARSGRGRALGPDFVMRLQDQGLTPDLLFIHPDHLGRLHNYYFDGPADLVIEITHDARRDLDLGERRERYEHGGVPEYWVVEPASQTLHCWHRANVGYSLTEVTHGTVNVTTTTDLQLDVDALWAAQWGRTADPFLYDHAADTSLPVDLPKDNGKLGWDSLPFTATATLDPVPIQFEQYIAWCPESKFERLNGRLSIASAEGTRRVMALLMMTLGLRKIVPCLPVLAWVVILHHDHYLPAIRADPAPILEQAHVDAAELGDANRWVGSIPELPVHVIADTEAACRQALERQLSHHLLYALAGNLNP